MYCLLSVTKVLTIGDFLKLNCMSLLNNHILSPDSHDFSDKQRWSRGNFTWSLSREVVKPSLPSTSVRIVVEVMLPLFAREQHRRMHPATFWSTSSLKGGSWILLVALFSGILIGPRICPPYFWLVRRRSRRPTVAWPVAAERLAESAPVKTSGTSLARRLDGAVWAPLFFLFF